MSIEYQWRGALSSQELNELHAEAFRHKVFSNTEWDWLEQIEQHSFGWATGRNGSRLIGFVNVISDGLVHAWIQDVIVAESVRHQGVGRSLVGLAVSTLSSTSHEWLHVDFDDELRALYVDACGFEPTSAALLYPTQH